ncbi:phage head closure protein [Sutcliffiella cohnii]|uniref:phage head closure protein n=1 Tax=Sutcliffiella cohnii TaxID=33932 RepID=UPI002E1FB2B3|nr:phage head closure protein [Sutcliffiella cohnii]MED4016995.1 phage head closure protein [Sutcliffiella cohnii]
MTTSLDDVIKLLKLQKSKNEIGDTVEIPIPREVFAKKKSIRQSEFYQSQSSGLKPEIAFDIWEMDYENETQLEYENKTFKIIRTYSRNDEMLELICEGMSVNG